MAIAGGKPCPGSGADAGFLEGRESKPGPSSSTGSPRALDRGGIATRGGDRGGVSPSPDKMSPKSPAPAAPTPPGIPGGDTHTLLRHPHPTRHSWRGYSYVSLRQPHPARAARSSPAPLGRGQCVAIPSGKPCPGNGADIGFWGERAGPEPVLPGLSRYTGPWWISPRGEGTGEGAPPPRRGILVRLSPAAPTPPGLRPPPPPPPGGEGSQGDTRWEAVPGERG